jgi:hypothetical protein
MKTFPKRTVELWAMFKESNLYVMHEGIQPNLYLISVAASEIKQKSDYQKVINKALEVAKRHGFHLQFSKIIKETGTGRFMARYNFYFEPSLLPEQ